MPERDVVDAMGSTIRAPRGGAKRVVSLVPSETETVVLVAGPSVLVGRTDYCVHPRGSIESIASVGGTKNASLAAIEALAPDLVLANQEENTREIVEGLRARGLAVHVSFPKTVAQGAALCDDIAMLLGVDPSTSEPLRAMHALLAEARASAAQRSPVRVFCPIWMDPLMTIRGDTFISDALDLAGGVNVFSDRARRYPLAADLGLRAPLEPARVADRDVRYPRVTADELVARAPEVVLLPDEPHPFSEADAEFFRSLDLPAARQNRVLFCEGRDLCWYSPPMGEGIARIATLLGASRP